MTDQWFPCGGWLVLLWYRRSPKSLWLPPPGFLPFTQVLQNRVERGLDGGICTIVKEPQVRRRNTEIWWNEYLQQLRWRMIGNQLESFVSNRHLNDRLSTWWHASISPRRRWCYPLPCRPVIMPCDSQRMQPPEVLPHRHALRLFRVVRSYLYIGNACQLSALTEHGKHSPKVLHLRS